MNKVLIQLYVPLIEQEYNLFVPINKKIGIVKRLIENSIIELTDGNFKTNGTTKLYNKMTSIVYNDEHFIKDTDIRNGTKLILL